MDSSMEIAHQTLCLYYCWGTDTWRSCGKPEYPFQWESCMHRAKPSFSQFAVWTDKVWQEKGKSRSEKNKKDSKSSRGLLVYPTDCFTAHHQGHLLCLFPSIHWQESPECRGVISVWELVLSSPHLVRNGEKCPISKKIVSGNMIWSLRCSSEHLWFSRGVVAKLSHLRASFAKLLDFLFLIWYFMDWTT